MSFEQFSKILLKRWAIVVICIVCVGLGAFIGSSKLMKPVYQSTVLVEVIVHSGGDPLVNDNILASQQLTQTEANLATTDPVLSAVASKYRGLSVDDLAKEVTATARDNTQLMQIDVLDGDPARAASLANNIANTLISQQLQVIQQKTASTPATAATSTSASTPVTVPASAQSFMFIAQPAKPSASPARPNKLIYVGAGLLIGILLGMVLAVISELLDPRIYTKEVLTQLLEWPILVTLGRISRKEEVINLNDYNSNIEAYSNLQTQIELATRDRSLHMLAITSTTPGDGKSVVAANLAISMAKTGKSVLLIDANLRHPTLHEQFDIPADAKGFGNAIVAFRGPSSFATSAYQQEKSKAYNGVPGIKSVTDEPSLAPFIRVTDIPNLYIMPSGPLPPYPPELLDSKAMQHLLVALSKSGADVIIFDAPALLGLADTIILATKVDGTLVVVDATRANKRHLQQAKAQLNEANVRVLGCVLNKGPRNRQKAPYKEYSNDTRKLNNNEMQNGTVKDRAAISPITSTQPPQAKMPSQPAQSNNEEPQAVNEADTSALPEDILNSKDQTVKYPTARTREPGE